MRTIIGCLAALWYCGLWTVAIPVKVLAVPGKAPAKKAPAKKAPPRKAANALLVRGTVKAITKPPRPRSVPYKDAVISIHLVNVKAVQGKVGGKEIVVLVWGMRNNTWTGAASYRAGQTVTLRLIPWERAERKYGSYNRFELQGEHVLNLDTYWGETP